MRPWSKPLVSKIEERVVESAALRGNPLGDPHERPIWVQLPPAYAADATRRFPVVYQLMGLTGQIDMWKNRAAFRLNVPELFDEVLQKQDVPPTIVVYVDCWTSLGGSQYVDSPGTGRYQTYLCDEVVPWVDAEYRTLAAREHRGVQGKSSGGYGAMIVPMCRPDVFSGLATHAGDALFENCFLPGFPQCVRALRDEYHGSFDEFWKSFRSRPPFSRESDMHMLNTWCMAACFSADEDGSVRLPFDPRTGALIPEIWERWLALDPVRMVEKHADALRGMKAIYVDAGNRDQWFLDLGATAFVRQLERNGIPSFFFELFNATHTAIEYRYPIALEYLAKRLA